MKLHQGDIDLLIAVLDGRKMTELAREAGVTPTTIRTKVVRAKERLRWQPGMGAEWVREQVAERAAAKQPMPLTVSAEEALAALLAIIDDSEGVAGYHRNGAVAEWGEFAEVDQARQVLADIQGTVPIGTLNLMIRTENILLAEGIRTVRQLCLKTEVDLLRTQFIDKKVLIEIKDALAARGKTLGWPKPDSDPL